MNIAEEHEQELYSSKIILARTERQVEEEKLVRVVFPKKKNDFVFGCLYYQSKYMYIHVTAL